MAESCRERGSVSGAVTDFQRFILECVLMHVHALRCPGKRTLAIIKYIPADRPPPKSLLFDNP